MRRIGGLSCALAHRRQSAEGTRTSACLRPCDGNCCKGRSWWPPFSPWVRSSGPRQEALTGRPLDGRGAIPVNHDWGALSSVETPPLGIPSAIDRNGGDVLGGSVQVACDDQGHAAPRQGGQEVCPLD